MLAQIDDLTRMVRQMRGAVQESIKAVAGIFHALRGVGGGPVCLSLPVKSGSDHGNGVAEIFEQQFLWVADRITELQRTVAHVTGPGDLRANVVVQVSREMQKQVPDAVAVRIRPVPYLFLR